MEGSIEKQARRAMRRLVFYRFLGEIFSFPQFILRACITLLSGLAKWFNRLEISIFCLEQDAARRYYLLTNLDIGLATGEPGRYAALNPDQAERMSESFMRNNLPDDD